VFRDQHQDQAIKLAAALGTLPLLAQLLINRGIDGPEAASLFLQTPLDALHNPFEMLDMERAARRIVRAINDREKIWIYGDYDVDGMTSTSLFLTFFRELGIEVSSYIPDRIEEGYGLNHQAIATIGQKRGMLIITADCGTNSQEEIETAKRLGMTLIVTDHHEPQSLSFNAYATLNPHREGCSYPFKGLTGVGVAFKLLTALRYELRKEKAWEGRLPNLRKHLDLVALGTIADVAPLRGENRILVKHGLDVLTKTTKVGLAALKQISKIDQRAVSSWDVAFGLAPRLNAGGRLGSADNGVELLTTDLQKRAETLAAHLNEENRKRQILQQTILDEAKRMIEEEIDKVQARTIVLASPEWHQGVVGIVASKLVEEYFRPTILIALKDGYGKGSGRSIPSFHLFEKLQECQELLEQFGGHKLAAGLKIRPEMVEAFRERFEEIGQKTLKKDGLTPEIQIDAVVSLPEIDLKTIEAMNQLAPFGSDNPQPLLAALGVQVISGPTWVGGKKNHLKLRVRQGTFEIEAVGFNMESASLDVPLTPGSHVDLVFTPRVNSWGGSRKVELTLKDIRLAS